MAARLVGAPRAAAATLRNLYSGPEVIHARASEGPVSFECARGVTQGCPAGSLAFNVAIAELLTDVSDRLRCRDVRFEPFGPLSVDPEDSASLVSFVALHDDIMLASSDDAALDTAIDTLSVALREVGLCLGPKSTLVTDRCPSPALRSRFAHDPVVVTECVGAPLYIPGNEADAGLMLRSIALDHIHPLRALEGAHPQDIVRVLRHGGPWTRLGYLASLTCQFEDEWDHIAAEAHNLTGRLLLSALGAHSGRSSEVTLAAAYSPTSTGGLGLPAPFLELALAPLYLTALRLSDDPTQSADTIEDHCERISKKRGIAYDLIGTLLASACSESDLAVLRLAHQAREEVRGLWSANACDRDRTLADPPLASKVLDAWLFSPLVDAECLCGEAAPFYRATGTFGNQPKVGPVGGKAVHVHGCGLNKVPRHDRVRDALGRMSPTRPLRRACRLRRV